MSVLSNIVKSVLGFLGPKVPAGFDKFLADAAPHLVAWYENVGKPQVPGGPLPADPITALKQALDIQRAENDKRLHEKHHPGGT